MTILKGIMLSQVIYRSWYKVTHLSISEEDFACYQNCWNDEHPKSVEIINENKIRALYTSTSFRKTKKVVLGTWIYLVQSVHSILMNGPTSKQCRSTKTSLNVTHISQILKEIICTIKNIV